MTTAIALTAIITGTLAMLAMLRADTKQQEKHDREYAAMRDRHIGNAIASLYELGPERASSRNSAAVQNEICEARARYIIAHAHGRDGLPY